MDAYLIVDPDSRNITIPEIESAFGVYGDNNAERKYFKSPRIVGNGIDLTECYLYVNYISASTKIGQILCDVGDAPNGTATEDEIVFSWPITRNVLDKNISGEIFFAVQAKTKTGDTVFTTRKAKGNCYESIEGTEAVAEEYADIVLQLISRMDKVEENIGLEVDNYFKENPVVTSEYLEKSLQPIENDVSSIKEDVEDVMHPKTPSAHPMFAFNQTLYDSFSAIHNGVLLRSDIVVPNQFCMCSNNGLDELSIRSCEKSGAENTTFDYSYFYWNDVQTDKDSYDFSVIYEYLTKMKRQGRRCALRLFPSCYNSSAIDYDGYKISFPPYIVDIMRYEKGQFTTYSGNNENHLMIDVNLDSVYNEWKKLWEKFSEWVYNTNIDSIPAIQLILYIDIGLAGPWGEGSWYDFRITTSTDNIVRYFSVILSLFPDTQLNAGKMYKGRTYDKNAIFVSVKELKNNVGYVGFFTDNIGSKNPEIDVNNIEVLEDGTKIWDLLDKYVKRGDFICGEFAMFDGIDYWQGEAGLWALERVRRLKMSVIKATNITLQLNDMSATTIKIKDISPYINYVISSAIAIVGARFVVTPFSFVELEDRKAKITWNISNIGTNTCRFDIFDVYYRVRNLDTGEYTDVKTNINLCDIAPYGEAMVYSINNGITVTYTIDTLYENYEIDLIALDKLDLQVPMYFSNYGRKDDGSYLLFPNSVENTYIDNIASRVIELEKTVKELYDENKCFRDNIGLVASVSLTEQYSVEDAANLPIYSLELCGNTSQDGIPTLSNQVMPVSVTDPVISIGDTSVTIKGTYRGIDDNSDVLLWDGLNATIIRKCAEETVTILEGNCSLDHNRIFVLDIFKNIYLTASHKSMLSFAEWSSYAENTKNNCAAVGKRSFYYRGNDGAGFETLEEGLGTLLGKTITIVGQLETPIIEEINDKDVITALKTLATVSGSNVISVTPTAKTTIKYYFDIKKYIDSKIK
jgi:hypothetical protein